ncbi:hypothetical protein LguiA_010781 [Lonicera macranthoides]
MDMAAASFHSPMPLSSSSSYYSLLHPLLSSPPPPSPPSPSRSSCFCCCSSSSHLHLHRSALSPAANKTLTHIKNSGVIACLRAQSGAFSIFNFNHGFVVEDFYDEISKFQYLCDQSLGSELALEAARAALSGGISVLEIVMSTPGFTTAGAGLSCNYNRGSYCSLFPYINCAALFYENAGLSKNVGTVLNAMDAKNAINAGAKFLMSPAIVMDILDDVQGSEALYIPGAMTPTEILTAYNAGAKIVKVYPVSAMGGSRYIMTLKKPFSHIQMVASQGINIDLIGEYIAEGASSVVLSDAIFDKEAMAQRNFNAISRLAHLAALQGNVAVERLEVTLSGAS